ncbi:MAG: tRNA uridine-5-carboxymethylaminomethyl(34) synthesis GTPase MnmE [Bacteroidetes bacterium]|nr:tRNA uridine-5-carboxymethylaminomethyl(34) synthesis GTPase MnmE [Bacteroidota bacterium]
MDKIQSDDTIAAIATPSGVGAISIIRVSGPLAVSATDTIFSGKSKLIDSHTHTIHYGNILDSNDNIVDDVLVSVFKAPNSYTGEDSVEISSHGSSFISQKIIKLLLENNVRLAESGEFTKRAFLNGKIDLAQAEAVADVINSRTEASLKGARNQLDGLLSQKVKSLREMLINTSSLVELELDFAEEDVEFIQFNELQKRTDSIINEIDLLLNSYSFGKVVRDGVNVALVGLTNVGKSSLLNYFLKEARAIVSKTPGTTRDVIREEVSINGILFRLYDTAGIRISEDEIEKEGVIRSREVIKNSDLILFINDVEQDYPYDLFEELITLNKQENIINVLNKIDLNKETKIKSDIKVSALTGEGINDLFNLMKIKVFGSSNYSEKNAVVSNLRHYNCLKKAKESLIEANNSISSKMSGEFIAVDLRNAENNLSEIIGEVTSDDILNNIFTKFCIGK